MSFDVKQSSTQAPLPFLLVQSSDHITGLTGASPTVTISKAGGSFASPSGSVTEIANGWYKVAGNATDTGTLGPILLHATAASGDPCDTQVANVVAYDPQDAVRAGLTALPNAAANAAGGLPVSAAGSLDLDEMNADIELIQGQTDKLTFTVANQVDSNVLDWKSSAAPAMTGDAFARLGAPVGASISVDIAALKSDLDGGVTVTSAGRNAIADSILARNMKGGSSTGRSVYQAFATLRNKSAIVAGLLTVYDEDDSTALFEANITTAAGDPISAIAPTT